MSNKNSSYELNDGKYVLKGSVDMNVNADDMDTLSKRADLLYDSNDMKDIVYKSFAPVSTLLGAISYFVNDFGSEFGEVDVNYNPINDDISREIDTSSSIELPEKYKESLKYKDYKAERKKQRELAQKRKENYNPSRENKAKAKAAYLALSAFDKIKDTFPKFSYDILSKNTDEYNVYDALSHFDIARPEQFLSAKYAKDNGARIYESVDDVEPYLRDFVKNKIYTQLGFDRIYTTKGIHFNSDSDICKRLAQNKTVLNMVSKHLEKLDNGSVITTSMSFHDELLNWKATFGNVDILFMQKNLQGDILFFLVDTYDFNKYENSPLVMAGSKLIDDGIIQEYFSVYSVVIPSEVVKELEIEKEQIY